MPSCAPQGQTKSRHLEKANERNSFDISAVMQEFSLKGHLIIAYRVQLSHSCSYCYFILFNSDIYSDIGLRKNIFHLHSVYLMDFYLLRNCDKSNRESIFFFVLGHTCQCSRLTPPSVLKVTPGVLRGLYGSHGLP